MNLKIEYENDEIVVVNKPAGLPVYSTKKNSDEDSVLRWFLEKYPDAAGVGEPERPGIVHRLDKQTSGLLILAKTGSSFEFLSRVFRSREIVKEYRALVYGRVEKYGVIDRPLTKIGYEGQSRVRVDEAGKEAKTEYWPLETFEHGLDQFTLVRVKLHTGRTHQIRVHFAHLQHPVMGDDLYGKPYSQRLSSVLHRQFLHAARLEFQLPDKTWIDVQSELPEDLQKVLTIMQNVNIKDQNDN